MNSRHTARIGKGLVLVLASLFVLPVVAGWVLRIPLTDVPATAWLRNATLGREANALHSVPLTVSNVVSARYQDAAAKNDGLLFAGRELVMRVVDDILLRVLHVTPTVVVLGRHGEFIEYRYIHEYCLHRGKDRRLRRLAANLRRLQDACNARGIAFAGRAIRASIAEVLRAPPVLPQGSRAGRWDQPPTDRNQ